MDIIKLSSQYFLTGDNFDFHSAFENTCHVMKTSSVSLYCPRVAVLLTDFVLRSCVQNDQDNNLKDVYGSILH